MKPETVGNGYLLIENAHCSTSGWGLATPGILGQLSSQSSSGQIRTLVGTVQTGGDDLPLRLEEAEPEISCLGGSEIIDSCGDGGCVPNVVLVAVSPRRTEEAEAEFRRQEAFEIERCQSRDECPMAPNVPENAVRYILQVPGLREETVAENLRRLPYILAAERATADAGAPAEGITLTSSRFFNNLPPDDAVARNRIQQAFARYFRASGLRFQVLNRSAFFYRVEIEGPSRFLAKGQPNAWERLVFEVILTHLFSRGGKDDMLTVFLSVPSAKWAVWPDGQKPNPARLKEFEGPELSALQVRLLSQLSMDVAPGRARGK